MALDTDTPEGGKTCLREDNNREDDDFSFTDSGDEDSGDEDSGDEDSGYSKSLFLDLFIPKFKRVRQLSVADCERELIPAETCGFCIKVAWDADIGAWYIPITANSHNCNKDGTFP